MTNLYSKNVCKYILIVKILITIKESKLKHFKTKITTIWFIIIISYNKLYDFINVA